MDGNMKMNYTVSCKYFLCLFKNNPTNPKKGGERKGRYF
jgi:hypothetical protein